MARHGEVSEARHRDHTQEVHRQHIGEDREHDREIPSGAARVLADHVRDELVGKLAHRLHAARDVAALPHAVRPRDFHFGHVPITIYSAELVKDAS